ncbi:MAG: glutamate racemase [Candidatus Marinimicrobia bacterium]|jgi:glutamate racemase|nr:glutamate racemase [Candidatus Neomarinimicrobiota bacterium]
MNKNSNSRPIGIFDSGVGGLTVLNALKKQLPFENMIYVGDTARVPYGNKSEKLIQQYAREICDLLISLDCKMIVIACNTASSLALTYLRSSYALPIEGVIEPGVEEAIKHSRNKHIGVLGTHATIRSNVYESKLKKLNPDLMVTNQACPLFVPLAEEGWVDGEIPEKIAKYYLNPLVKNKVDTVILGCTHYPILKATITNILPKNVHLIDSAEVVAQKVKQILAQNKFATESKTKGHLECLVTDMPNQFSLVADRFVDFAIGEIKAIELH